jgi:hypothetical protein
MSAFPATRLRRLRRTGALRGLVRETSVSLDDLVLPLFVAPEALPNERLPALSRFTVDGVVRECEEVLRAGERRDPVWDPGGEGRRRLRAWIEACSTRSVSSGRVPGLLLAPTCASASTPRTGTGCARPSSGVAARRSTTTPRSS